MSVVWLSEKVTFQKNDVVRDRYGNHLNEWDDFYTCFATIGGEGLASSKEKEVAGMTVEDVSMTVTIRYCQKASQITSTGFRLRMNQDLYDILNVDHLNYKKKFLKFTCRKVRR